MNNLEDIGASLVQQILGLGRTMHMYEPTNHAVTGALTNMAMSLNSLIPHGKGMVKLQFIDNILIVNEDRVNPKRAVAPSFEALKQVFFDRGIGGFAFMRAMDPETLRRFFTVFIQPVPDESSRQRLRATLDQFAAEGIELLQIRTLGGDDEIKPVPVSSMGFALQSYARAIMAFREFVKALREGRDPLDSPLNVVRVVQELIEVAQEKPSNLARCLWLMAVQRDALAGDPGSLNAGNAAITAIMIGRVLGLGRLSLLDLGSATLLASAPTELCPGVVPADERARTRAQVQDLFGQAMPAFAASVQFNAAAVKRLLVSAEYLLPYLDPVTGAPSQQHPYSRLAAVAHGFNARLGNPQHPLPPPHAFADLQTLQGSVYDPVPVAALGVVVQGYMGGH